MLFLDPFHCTICGDELEKEERLKHTGLCRGCEWIEKMERYAAKSDAKAKKAVCKKRG